MLKFKASLIILSILIHFKFSFSQFPFEKEYDHGYTETFYSITVSNEKVFLSGYQFKSFSEHPALLKATDPAGEEIWTRIHGSFGEDYMIVDHVNTPDSSIVYVGYYQDYSTGDIDPVALKYKENGDFIWEKKIQQPGLQAFFSVAFYKNNLYAVGRNQDSSYLVKLNNNGDTIFTKVYYLPVSSMFRGISGSSDNSLLVAGYVQPNDAEALAVKLDTSGNIQWAKTFGTDITDDAFVLTELDSTTYLFNSFIHTPSGEEGVTLIKLNQHGDSILGRSFFQYRGFGSKHVIIKDSAIFLPGTYIDTSQIAEYIGCNIKLDWNLNELGRKKFSLPDSYIFSAAATDEGFYYAGFKSHNALLIYSDTSGFVNSVKHSGIFSKVEAFPNPFFDQVTIKTSEQGNVKLGVFDLTGRLLYEDVFQSQIVLDLSDYTPSTYIVRLIYQEEASEAIKLIKQ